jgi:hypothetical protein
LTTESPIGYWLSEIKAAKKRDKDYRKDGLRILEIYGGEKSDTIPFNILFSNTETLLPTLYSAVPRPVVDRRFKDGDMVGKAAATAGQRVLEFLLDTNVDGYETYDEAMRAATLDALLPGRGVTCVKYDAELGQLPTASVDDSTPASEDAKGEPEKEGAAPGEKEPTPYKKSELVCCDARSWNRVLFGYAKKWSKVPWIAFEENVDKEEATRLFGKPIAEALVYTTTAEEEDEEKKKNKNKGETQTATIYQIWDKDGGRKVRYVAEQFKEAFLKVEDDPLELTGFYNLPKPIQFIEKSNDLTPVAPYTLYENQAKELNRLTNRINKIIQAIKARGIYDGELGEDIANVMKLDDNELVAADKNSSLAAEKGLGNAIWFMPVEQLVNVLRELYTARENCKAVIFEIMGLADIMRGASQASETLGAQQIKQTWGSLRLKRQQKEVQRYARDLLRLMLELAATKFSEETWAKMTGLPYLTAEQFAKAQAIAQAAQQQIQAAQAMPPQVDPQTQQPMPNPQVQQAQQQLQQAQQELQKPQWSQILGMLKDDIQRSYRIDIETNSTVEPEAVEDQKNIADVMNALGQYLNGVGPLVQKGVMPFQAAQAMMLAIVRRFRFGAEIEDYIQQMKAPALEDNSGDLKKHAAEQQTKVQETQIKSQAEAQRRQDEHAAEKARSDAETQRYLAEQETKRQEIGAELTRDREQREFERREKQAERQSQRAIESDKSRCEQDTELRKAALQAAVAIETAAISATKSAEAATSANEAAGTQVANTAEVMARILERQEQMLAIVTAPPKFVKGRDAHV